MDKKNIENFLDDFYAKVREDELLGEIFNNEVSNWGSHLNKVLVFWVHHTLEPGLYKGNLLKIHQKLDEKWPLSLEHFQRWLKIFEFTAGDYFDDADFKKLCLKARIVAGTLYGRIHNLPLEVPQYPSSDLF
jgi:hemoglobin